MHACTHTHTHILILFEDCELTGLKVDVAELEVGGGVGEDLFLPASASYSTQSKADQGKGYFTIIKHTHAHIQSVSLPVLILAATPAGRSHCRLWRCR